MNCGISRADVIKALKGFDKVSLSNMVKSLKKSSGINYFNPLELNGTKSSNADFQNILDIVFSRGKMRIPTNKQPEYAKYILEEWNKSQEDSYSLEDNSKKITEKLEEIPSIKLGLSNIFVNPTAVTKFRGYTKASIIAATVMNNGNEVVSNRELNKSLINLQNRIGKNLAKLVGLEEKNIYNEDIFDRVYYDKLVRAARAFINPFLKDGKLNPELGNNRTDFYDYILLTQFDDIIELYIPNIRILPSLKGNKNISSGVYKYGFNNGNNIIWGQGDSIVNDDIDKHTNNAVKNYITSLREINRNNIYTGNQILFRDFNALVGVILNSKTENLKDLRFKPSEAIPKIFDEIYNNIDKFLSGENKCLRNTFYTIYRNIFDKDNYSSLLATNRRSSKVSKNDLYYMICNHFNKSTTMNYYRMAYELNPDYNSSKKGSKRGWYTTKMLTSSNYDNAAYNIKSRLTILPVISSDYSRIRDKYKVEFGKKDNTILDISFTIGNDTIILKLDGTKSLVDEKLLDNIGSNQLYTDFFNEVFGQNYNTSFYKEMKDYNINNVESNTNGLQALFKLASNVFLSNELGFDEKSNISSKISSYISDSSNWYNDNLNCIDPTKLGSVRDAVDLLAYGISYLNKDFTKSYVTLSNGAHMPRFGLSSLNASDNYLFDNIDINESSPFYYNLLFNNRTFRDKMKNVYKTEVINREGIAKQISEMKTEELIYNALVSEYFSGNDEFYIIQPAVYADKTKIQSKMIDAKTKFEFVYIDENGNINSINKSFSEMTLDDLYNLHYGTIRPQIQKLRENIEKDYKTLFSILHELYPSKYSATIPNTYEEFIPLLNKLTEDELYNGLKAIQVRNPNGNFTFVDQIHYVNNKGKFEANNLLQYYFKRYITNSKEEYNNKNKLEEKWFAESIRQFGVRLDLMFSDGSINYAIQDRIDKVKDQDQKDYIKSKIGIDISATYEELWVDKDTQTLIPYLIVKDGKLYYDENIDLTSDNVIVVLNPELARYKAIDNLISDNYNLATVGLPFAHPSKVKATDLTASGIKAEEAARTTAFTKRQVVDGATGHNLILNKLDGVPNRIRISCIKDLSELTASISGNTGKADIADGALRVSPFFHHWFANSSPELQHSTTFEKPLGYFQLSKYLTSSLWKCASFAITNECIRNSITSKINGEALLKLMTDKEWPIEKLDLSRAVNSLLLKGVYFCDPYTDLNTHYQVKSIEYLGNNNYTVEYSTYDNNGNKLKDVIQKQVSINSNYDLWKLFGGAYSESRINGRFVFNEESTELVATVGNKVTLTDKDIPSNIPEEWIIQNGSIRIFQPMKYSDIQYLNNTSGVKVGVTNVNPSSFYHRPITNRINKGELVFAHSTTGKSFASKMGYNIIDFDTQYAKELKLAKEELNQNGDRNLYINKLISLLNSAVNSGKTVLFSDIELLDAISNSDSFNVSKILTLNNDEYTKRYLEREGTLETATSKDLIDLTINKYLESHENTKLIDSSNGYIQDYLDSPLLYSSVDLSYLIIQLTADHEVDNATVSEMTQVISAMEQKAETHDIAMKMYESIGSFISAKLRLYDKWDVNTEAGKIELNTILGKTLCRIFKNDDEAINLATAIISSVKEELSKSGKISKPIPFDDNNIISKFEINIKNGFTKDIIKRQFDGFSGVMTPNFDIYSIYDMLDGNILSANALIEYGRKNGKSNISEALSMLDVEVPGYKIRMGDWVEIDGKVQQVGSISSTLVDGGITLAEVRSLPSVKKLGSKGRNIRAQNCEVLVSAENINNGRTEFDLYDLDSVNFIYNLERFVENFEEHKLNNSILYQIFSEINNSVEYKDGDFKLDLETLINSKSAEKSVKKLIPYVKEKIQKDLRSISDGFYPIPISFRIENASDNYATILTSKYSANEIAVDKPFADKFLLDEGDNLSDVNEEFFINKLTNRGRTNLDKEYWTTALIGKNYKLHFVSSEQFKNLRNNVKDIVEINIDSQKVITPENTYRVAGDITYPVTSNMKFYKVTISGESFEIVVGASVENIREIYKTNNFYTADFNITTENKELLSLYNEVNHTDYPDLDSFKKVNHDDRKKVEIKRQAKKMYQSFKEACKVIAARIPAQSMQSFMNMKIVAFTNFGTNTVQTPLEMLIFEGSDFDIDKIYVMMSSISKNGIYSDWSPYFNYYSDNNFNIAKTLPLPSRIEYQIGSKEDVDKDNSNTVDVSEYVNVLDLYNIHKKNRSNEENYRAFVERFNSLMNVIKDKNRIYSDTKGPELLSFINKHTMYKYNESEVIKNMIFNYMYNIGSNPKNYLSETSILTVAPARKAAAKSSMGKFGNNNSNENPGAKMNAQDQNMVGKSSIAVYANGIKAFSSLLLFFQDKLTNIDKVNEIFNSKLKEFSNIIDEDLQKIKSSRPDLAEYIDSKISEYKNNLDAFESADSLDISALYAVYKPYADLAKLISKYEDNNNVSEDELTSTNLGATGDGFIQSGFYLKDGDDYITAIKNLVYLHYYKDVRRFKIGGKEYKFKDADGEFTIKLSTTLPNINILSNPSKFLIELKNDILNNKIQEDVYETLGIMLNVSTDNAKELVLEKINGAGKLANVYIYLIASGASFDSITRFMTSRLINAVGKEANSSLFKEDTKYNNLQRAINTYIAGVNLSDFIPGEYINNAVAKLNNLVKELGIEYRNTDNRAKFTEKFGTLTAKEIGQIISHINNNNIKFNLDKRTKDEIEAFEDYEYSTVKLKESTFLINRFLNKALSRVLLLESEGLAESKDTLIKLVTFANGGQEISTYSQLCGINQGVKALRDEYFTKLQKLEKFISDRIDLHIIAEIDGLHYRFDFLRFISDEDYRNDAILRYERAKTSFNILEAINSSPHLREMYRAMYVSDHLLSSFSYKYNLYKKLINDPKVYSGKIQGEDKSKIITGFINDLVTAEFFDRSGISINLQNPIIIYNSDFSDSLSNIKSLTLNNVFNRASFKRWMESYVIPTLKKNYPNNSFIKDLTPDSVRSQIGSTKIFYKLPVDLNKVVGDYNEVLYDNYVLDFNNLRRFKFEGNNIGDLFFIYNLLISNNSFGGKTITRIFEDMVREADSNSIVSKFLEFESDLPNLNIDYDINDLNIRFKPQTRVNILSNSSRVETFNGETFVVFTKDNTSMLFFKDKTNKEFSRKVNTVHDKLMELFDNNKIQIKLSCDE